jgi:hypothetical protein
MPGSRQLLLAVAEFLCDKPAFPEDTIEGTLYFPADYLEVLQSQPISCGTQEFLNRIQSSSDQHT